MKEKAQKGYWVKRRETFTSGATARSRASGLRQVEHVSHVKMDKQSQEYVVSYSVAKWYVQELEKADLKL